MNSSTRLDSAVFQLTPTRTRCDLFIIVNGKKEKIASGLLDPFLSHLKTAQDQMAKGGYSITLEPEHVDSAWFTRGTVERFVRFVSTPEILERIYTVESEILQIEEAIAIQGNTSMGISPVEENPIKQVENAEGASEKLTNKTLQDTNEEKAIVLYKQPEGQPPEANGTTQSEGNSKVQLLKVLETRKSVLQKEQGMAFARAVAAGFDIDYIPALVSFAECFGASRMKDACKKFMELWKRKHESGQWLEIAPSEAIPNRLDFSPVNTSGIILSSMAATSHSELDSENNGKANADVSPMDRQPSIGHQENIQGQFPHQMYPPWPVHSPPGTMPVFQPYPMPYYQNYPGSPFMQPIYPPMEDPRVNSGQSMRRRRHSMDSRYSNAESETWDEDASKSRMQDEVDMERKGSQTGEQRKKASRLGRQKSGMVVIRNINYITKAENSSGSGSYSDSASEDDEDKDAQDYVKTSKRRVSNKDSLKKLNSSNREETDLGNDADGGHWQAFQSCLLRDVDEDRHAIDQDQFELEKADRLRSKKHVAVNDPLVSSELNRHEIQGGDSIDMHGISKGLTHLLKASNDELLLSRRAAQSCDGRSVDDMQSSEIDGRRGGYRRTANDDFIVLKQECQSGNAHPSSDLAAVNGLGYSNNNVGRKSLHDMNDDSYIVEYRSIQASDVGDNGRNAIDMDSELPVVHQKAESELRNHINYQPDELSLMPERGAERGSIGYDPALDYEMQVQTEIDVSRDKKNKEVSADLKPGSKRLDKEQKSKLIPNSSDKKKNVGPIRRGKASKMSPLDEARARAEKLRNYKADLQKMKKEKEAEELKRLEALKIERQKRIAARSSSIPATVSSPLTKKQPPTKLSPSSHKGSKFSDAEPGSSSPLQRFPVRTASIGSNDSIKALKPGRLNTGSHSAKNKLSRSVSSLPESKQEKGEGATDTKASMARIRRLSEPKMSTVRQNSTVKPQGTATISKTKLTDGPESKKISAIVNHDKSKTATLPELKVRTAEATDIVHNRSSVKEKTQKLNGSKPSVNSEGALLKKTVNAISSPDNEDDNPIIEKNVVVHESEKLSAPSTHMSEEKVGLSEKRHDNFKVIEKTETVSDYVAIRAPVSPGMNIVNREIVENQAQLQPISTGVKTDNIKKEQANTYSTGIEEGMYYAPVARVSSMEVSSMEDPCTGNSEYVKSPPNIETAPIVMETVRAHVSESRNSTLEKILEVVEKPQVKESSKGFRRLLKFGRKNHSSATAGRNSESDNVSIEGSEADEVGTNGSSKEVHILKNLISQDETPSATATTQKSSRSFSLLSPFRSKNSEKKVMMA